MSTSTDPVRSTLFAAVLAAGQSRRFGSTKLLARFRGSELVTHAVRAAERVCSDRTLLVVGSEWPAVHEACRPLAGFLVINDRYADGMSASIAAAVRALPGTATGLLLMLADQPVIRAEDLELLIGTWRDDPERIVCSRFGTQLTPPTLFPRSLFSELMTLHGDQGARPVIDHHKESVVSVEVPHAEFDVDTPEALEKLEKATD